MDLDLGDCLVSEETPDRLGQIKNCLAREVKIIGFDGDVKKVYDRLVALLAKDASNGEDIEKAALTNLAIYLQNLEGVRMTGPCNLYHVPLKRQIAEYAGGNFNWSLGLDRVAEEIYNQRIQLKKAE